MKKILTLVAITGTLLAFSGEVLADAHAELEDKIKEGHHLFSSATFQGNGRVCETCHVAGGHEPGHLPNGKPMPSLMNAATIFPRVKHGQVTTLEDQIRKCVGGALEGTPPDYGTKELGALSVYVTSLSEGKPIHLNGTPQ